MENKLKLSAYLFKNLYHIKRQAVSTCKCTNDCKVKKYFHKSIQTENENSIFLSDDDLFCL